MELASSRWCSVVLSWSLSFQSSHWCFGVGRRHFSHWMFVCGLHKFGCGQSLEWGWLHLQREAALLVHCVRIVILFPSRGSGQAPHSREAERAGKRAIDQPGEKRCLVISPGSIPLWTCFGCGWTFGKATALIPIAIALFMTSFISILWTLQREKAIVKLPILWVLVLIC